jgi:hypothetical protein
MLEPFAYQRVYAPCLSSARRVYARKRIDMMPDARISKLLIQSAFTSPNGNFKPVYRQRPIWG